MDPFKPYRQRQRSEKGEDRPNYKAMLDSWERDFRLLQIEYEKFFNGAEAVPPEDFKNRLGNQLRSLRNSRLTSVEQFRLGSLEARFNSYNELFQRRQRTLEEGRTRAAAARAAGEGSDLDPRDGVTVGSQVSGEAAGALYGGLCQGAKPPRFDLASFSEYLERQATMIRDKTGCEKVQFRVEQDGDKMRLKAKPIRG